MLDLNRNGNFVLLCGDFNSRTVTRSDFDNIIYNDNETNILDIEVSPIHVLRSLWVNITRENCDHVLNNYGNLLLNMCKSNDLTILNGRFGENTTGFTCKDRSVVDYFIGTIDVIKYISNMKILEHSTLYSDVHKPITLELKSKQPDITSSNNCLNGTDDYVIKNKHWEKSKEPTFLELIDMSAVDEIMNK